jgi:hypothetical protein
VYSYDHVNIKYINLKKYIKFTIKVSSDRAVDPDLLFYLTKLYTQWRRYISKAAMLYKHFMWSLHIIEHNILVLVWIFYLKLVCTSFYIITSTYFRFHWSFCVEFYDGPAGPKSVRVAYNKTLKISKPQCKQLISFGCSYPNNFRSKWVNSVLGRLYLKGVHFECRLVRVIVTEDYHDFPHSVHGIKG